MTKLEKVITGLECHRIHSVCINEKRELCPYFRYQDCYIRLTDDALELLKTIQPKPYESKAMLPCKCGCKRREHWYSGSATDKPEGLKCTKCGFTVWGKDATDVIREWNKAVKK